MTATLTEERTEVVVADPETYDPDEVSHIVLVPPGEGDETPQAYVMRARFGGFPIKALCGYTWVPNKMATGLPVCPKCKAIYDNDPLGWGDRDELPDE